MNSIKKLVIITLCIMFVVNENIVSFAAPASDTWSLHYSYNSSATTKYITLVSSGNGYKAKITSLSGNDPENYVIITCTTNYMAEAIITVPNIERNMSPSSPFGNTVQFKVSLQHSTGNYTTVNSGTIWRA